MNFRLINVLFILFLFSDYSSAQNIPDKDTLFVLRTVIIDGDTILNVSIDEVVIFPRLVFKSKYRERRYLKLIRDVKKAYPYAIFAKNKLDEMEIEFQKLANEKERKRYVKALEKNLMEEFGNELKKLTITQGRILLKLIDRETGNTSYELVKELRGSVSAVFWQTIARIFGSDLRSPYDPQGEDLLIERVVKLIETGQISLDDNIIEKIKISQ